MDGLRVQDDVFIGPQATFTNDPFPRSRQPFHGAVTTLCAGASIGAGAVILPGVTVGERAWSEPARSSPRTCPPTPWSSAIRRGWSGPSTATHRLKRLVARR